MKHGPLVFLGVFLAMAGSWGALVLAPQLQLGRELPRLQPSEETGSIYPVAQAGMAHQGLEVYRANGCAACHTRIVRGSAGEIPRWGPRITVGADYLYDSTVLPGTQRIGPDLSNIGARQPDAAMHLLHLYSPQFTLPGSKMPPFKFLFEKRKIGRAASADALKLTGLFGPDPGYEIVPKPAAMQLVAYLKSLRADADLFEAPLPASLRPPPGTNTAQAAGTNSPAILPSTNSVK